jgi:type IV pilus assembly protein PilV
MRAKRQPGFTMIEVLITLVVLVFGILGLANLQAKMHVTEMESYQRGQAVILLQDMASRISANRASATNYVTTANSPAYLGVGETAACGVSPETAVSRDMCQWSTALKGAAETTGGSNVGAMVGARGCVEQIQAPNPAAGVCTPGIFRITVVWQGMNQTADPAGLTCASTVNFGGTGFRRAVSYQVTIGQPTCI